MIDRTMLAAALALALLSLVPGGAFAEPPDTDRLHPSQAPDSGVVLVAQPARSADGAWPGEAREMPSAPDSAADRAASEEPRSPAPVSWLTAYRFHLAADSVRTADPRFDWDAHFGGDVDVVDYRVGRVNMLADYEVMIGSEFRTIDPNQGAYRLELSASWRTHGAELQGVFRHVSRHLSDRANRQAVSWNGAGAAVVGRHSAGPLTAAVDLYGVKIVQSAFVDYTWQFGTDVDGEYRLSPAVAIIARGGVRSTLVTRAVAGRGPQVSGRIESGVRLSGKGAGLELVAAWERRLDPYPLEYAARNWALVGFRFVSN